MFRKQELKEFLENLYSRGVVGCSIAVLRDGKETFRHYTGFADKENETPMERNTIFRIYSMTKVVTVTAALQLYEKGLFHLNDPLELYMPEFSNMKVTELTPNGSEQIRPAQRQILIKDLFCMTAGFTYNGYDGRESVSVRGVKKLEAELELQWPDKTYTLQEYIRRLAQVPLAFEPGTHWQYSLAHTVLGGLVERLSDMSLGEYMKQNIFLPLGMEDTFFRIPEDKKMRLAALYQPDGDGGVQKVTNKDACFMPKAVYENGGGGLLSTLDDYLKFAYALCKGGAGSNCRRILGRKTVDFMCQNHLNEEMMKDLNWPRLAGYGYGLGVRTMVNLQAGGCNGSIGEFGWSGMAGSWVLMDPMESLTVVYMQQLLSDEVNTYIQPRLRTMIYAALGD